MCLEPKWYGNDENRVIYLLIQKDFVSQTHWGSTYLADIYIHGWEIVVDSDRLSATITYMHNKG